MTDSCNEGVVALERESLLTAHLDDTPTVAQVTVARIELPPTGKTGRHSHPCPVVGVVLSGAVRFQLEGHRPVTLQAGDAFCEPANAPIAQFDNASDDEAATFLAWYLLPPGEHRLIEMLPSDPGPA